MGVNRYTNYQSRQPVSSYVPMPLDALYKIGKDADKAYEDTNKKLVDATDPFAKLNLNAGSKVYDPSAPGGIRDASLDFEDIKNQTVASLDEEKNKIAADYIAGEIDNIYQYRLKSQQYVTKAFQEYNKLKAIDSIAETMRKHSEEVSKNKDFATDPYYGQQLLAYNTQYMNDLKKGKIAPYNPYDVAEKFDSAEELNKHALHFAESGDASAYDAGDYLREVSTKGVSGTRVSNYIDNSWKDSKERTYGLMKINHDIAAAGDNPERIVDYTEIVDQKGKDGKYYPVEVKKKGKLIDVMEAQAKDEFHNRLAAKIVHQTEESHIKGDWKAEADYKHKLDNDIVRFSVQGMGINPQSIEKSSGELNNSIEKFKSSITELNKLKSTLPANSPEWVRADSQAKWNEIQLARREELREKAVKEVGSKQTTSEDKAIVAKYGDWNPGDFSDPNYGRLLKKYNLPSTSTVKELFEAMGSKDPIGDAKKLGNAYNRKNINIDKYLKNTSDNFTLQPNLITVDSEKELKTSKAIEDMYNNGVGSWEVYDENGPVTDPDKIPKHLRIPQISEKPVDKLGYLFGATEEIRDDKGKVVDNKKYYVKPAGEHNINEKIGKDLMDENSKKDTPAAKSRYHMGLEMVYPQFATQVSEIREGTSRDIQTTSADGKSNRIMAKVTKKKTPAGTVYEVDGSGSGYGTKTYSSEEEVLQVLNAIK